MKPASLQPGRLGGIGCLLLAAFLWGCSFPVGKAAMLAVDAYFLTSIRYGVAAVILVLALLLSEGVQSLRFDGRMILVGVLGIVGIGGGVLMMFVGLHRTHAEHAAVIVATQPLVAALVTWMVRGQRPDSRTLLAVGLAFTGVALVVTRGAPLSLAGSESVTGDLLVLGAALCWVTYTLSAAAFPTWSALRFTALTAGAGTVFVVAVTLVTALLGAATLPTTGQLVSVGWQIAFVTFGAALLGTLCWNIGIQRIGPNGVLFINFVPITAFIIGVARGYAFNWAEVLGALLVIVALVSSRLEGASKNPSAAITSR
ncbi:DMT family transporter [Herbaspirillum sp. GCM10030257]|uniref:DMT family transporter n=1 Tax=Herbaspirillum sp. GCM10030257 TaxID=3273393 RepID=UPI00362048AC